jgi:hypothetical protein
MEHIAHMGKTRNVYKILVGRPKEKRPLKRSRHRWEYEIKMKLKEICCEDEGCICLVLEKVKVMDSCEHGKEPQGSIKGEKID